jgi:hypothetical protein
MDAPTPEEYLEKRKLREQYKEETIKIQRQMIDLNAEYNKFKGRLGHPVAQDISMERDRLKHRLLFLSIEARKLKWWLSEYDELAPEMLRYRKRHKTPNTNITEYDLKNSLMEPQSLLHKAYCRLERMWKNFGITSEDRGLKDTIEDYLKRQGILLS